MQIGIPKETMTNEGRVAQSPQGVYALTQAGHEVIIESGAGEKAFYSDEDFQAAGATIGSTEDAWSADLVLKVKEPLPEEFQYLRDDLTLFTYLHLAANAEVAEALVQSGTTAYAYEAVRVDDALPLLTPMSQVAGRLSVLEGAHHLLKGGVLLPGVPGTPPAHVLVIGGGQVGASAVAMAVGLRASVTVMDVNAAVLERFDDQYHGRVRTVRSDPATVAKEVAQADLVIGAVLVAGDRAPKIVSTEMIEAMRPNSVLVDVAIDQGGCFEPSRKTSLAEPTYRVGEAVMYCVPNMPGAAGHTATQALASATLPFVQQLIDGTLETGLQVQDGKIVDPVVAAALS